MVAFATQPSTTPSTAHRIDHERARAAVRELLVALGEDPDRDGLRDTPRRVAAMYAELFAGLASDPAAHLERTFAEHHDELIVLRDIELSSLCEHHLLPFMGRAHVAYLPRRGVVGLSKLARVVEGFARRPQIQERLTNQIADAVFERTGARGAMVMIEAEHLCMRVRGVNQRSTSMLTTAARGELRVEPVRERTLSVLRGR